MPHITLRFPSVGYLRAMMAAVLSLRMNTSACKVYSPLHLSRRRARWLAYMQDAPTQGHLSLPFSLQSTHSFGDERQHAHDTHKSAPKCLRAQNLNVMRNTSLCAGTQPFQDGQAPLLLKGFSCPDIYSSDSRGLHQVCEEPDALPLIPSTISSLHDEDTTTPRRHVLSVERI